jgi:hypothetical protein
MPGVSQQGVLKEDNGSKAEKEDNGDVFKPLWLFFPWHQN